MTLESYMLPCVVKKIFGVECFGCGTQRALFLVFEGKFSEAFQLFPAIFPMLFFFFFVVVNFFDRKKDYGGLIIGSAIGTTFIMVVSYFFRHYEFFNL